MDVVIPKRPESCCGSCTDDLTTLNRLAERATQNERAMAVLHQRAVEDRQRVEKKCVALEVELESARDCGESETVDACGECLACRSRTVHSVLGELNRLRVVVEEQRVLLHDAEDALKQEQANANSVRADLALSREANAQLRAERERLALGLQAEGTGE